MRKRQMLIVEDERDIANCLAEFFTLHGYAVISTFSGEEALTHVEKGETDVILLDVLLPGLSGLEVLKRIKRMRPKTRVIMVTAIDAEDVRIEARRHGACGFVTKPFDFSHHTWSSILSAPPIEPQAT